MLRTGLKRLTMAAQKN